MVGVLCASCLGGPLFRASPYQCAIGSPFSVIVNCSPWVSPAIAWRRFDCVSSMLKVVIRGPPSNQLYSDCTPLLNLSKPRSDTDRDSSARTHSQPHTPHLRTPYEGGQGARGFEPEGSNIVAGGGAVLRRSPGTIQPRLGDRRAPMWGRGFRRSGGPDCPATACCPALL
jgi:hypothetical protein